MKPGQMRRRIAGTVATKLQALGAGATPGLLDLFAGCGGFTLGFVSAGFRSLMGFESDVDAASTYALNFHSGSSAHAASRVIGGGDWDPRPEMSRAGLADGASQVHVLVAGPPCPAFTRVGRAKLASVKGRADAHRVDPRARLHESVLGATRNTAPIAVVIENVPDILNWSEMNVGEHIATELHALGYRCQYTLVNAAQYGVPQLRDRFILVAIHEQVPREFAFPQFTSRLVLPVGYRHSRIVAFGRLGDSSFFRAPDALAPDGHASASLRSAVTARMALQDLPPRSGYEQAAAGSRLSPSTFRAYAPGRPSSYAASMRAWLPLRQPLMTDWHVFRLHSERDLRLFRGMKAGDEYPSAVALAEQLLARHLARHPPDPHAFEELRVSYVPPYPVSTFPNRWRKMHPDQPARTVMAHMGKDSYSHIHYSSEQARTITVREAARLQSFPDGFAFCGTMNSAFRQIGNAVPPLLARAIAESLAETLGIGHYAARAVAG